MGIIRIVISKKFKQSDKGVKCFIGYAGNDVIRHVLPQMSGYIKVFESGGKNVLIRIEDGSVLVKYNDIWNRIKASLGIKFHSKPVYNEKYIKTKVKTFIDLVNTTFLGDEIPKEGVHYTCIAAINIDSVEKMDKKNYPQLYLEECSMR